VVVDPSHDLEIRAVGEQGTAHHVHLPQLHRTLALPPTELVATLPSTSQLDQPVALQAPIDGRARRDRVDPHPRQLVLDPPRSPARMLPAQLADLSLGLRGDLMWAGCRAVGAVGE
jgi:hypothetical protein